MDPDSKYIDPKFLIDCGSDIRHSLHAAGMSLLDITDVYISHLHGDHAGGLQELGFYQFFHPDALNKPKLYISSFLKGQLWNMLEPSMKSLANQMATLDTYFETRSIAKNNVFQWEKCTFSPVQQIHIMDEFTTVPSFGLRIELPDGKIIYFTTDTKYFPDQMMEFYKEATYIFQDCEAIYVKYEDETLLPIRSRVHSHYEDLKTLDSDIKNKMYLMHLQDNWMEFCDPISDGFKGIVSKGQIIEI
jgi:ribonuclease BN (tRNA processing enzyme)